MSTILVFIMTLAEMAAIVIGYFLPMPALFDAVVTYGSPPYFIINSLGGSTVAFAHNPTLPLLAGFHVVKYLAMARSQFVMERHSLHYLSIIFEIIYLAVAFNHL